MPSSAETTTPRGTVTVTEGRGSPLVIERCTPGPVSTAAVSTERAATVPFSTVHGRMLADQRGRAEGTLSTDQLLLFSPDPVVTLGSAGAESDLLLGRAALIERGVEIFTVDRGGETTYHGPGQRVGYLTLWLGEDERDLHRLLRSIEGALIDSLGELGLRGGRIEGKTGVWIEGRKIASIGLSVRRWVTGHGFALCVSGDLDPFSWIVPCGTQNCPYTTLEHELGGAPPPWDLDAILSKHFALHLDRVPQFDPKNDRE